MSSSIIAIFNKIGVCFCGHALAMLIQSSILILVLFVIDSLLRKRIRAVFRYCIWLLVFVKLILPPTLSLPTGIGYWCGDYWAANPTSTEVPSLPPVQYTEGLPTGYSVMPSEPPEVQPIEAAAEPPAPAIFLVVPASPSVNWEAGIFLGWFVGVLVLAVLLMQRVWFVRGLIAQSQPAEGKLTDIVSDCCHQLGIRKKIDLRISQNAQSPAACGLLKPKVLVPSSLLARLSSDKLRTALLHELAHIKRGDLWVNFGQTVLQIIYFYNPLLWLTNAMVRRVREQAVDEMVLAHLGDEAKNYSSTLVDIAEIAFARPVLGLRLIGVVESKKALAGRIKHILSKPFPKNAKLGIIGLIVVVVLAAVLLPMAKAEKTNVKVEVEKKPGTVWVQVLGPDGQPVPDATVELQVFLGGDVDDVKNNYRTYVNPTDANGRCVFEDVEPGEAGIGRFFWNDDRTGGGVPYGLSMPFEIEAGGCYEITLGGKGRPVIGRLVPASGKDGDIDWTKAWADFNPKAAPMTMGFMEDNLKILRAMIKSEGGNFYRKDAVNINPDGTFRIENVRAGLYGFRVKVLEQPKREGFNLFREVRVGLMRNGTTDRPLNLGTLAVSHGNHIAPPHIDNSFFRRFELNRDIPVKLKAGTDEEPDVVSAKSIRFEKDGELVKATLNIEYKSIADAKWRAKLTLQSKNGSALARDDASFETSKIIGRIPDLSQENLKFYLGRWPDLSPVKHFFLTIQTVNEELTTAVQVEGGTTNEADEVRYEGRTIDEWMAQWDSRVSDNIDAATNALIKIGRPAVPRMAEEVKKRTNHGWHAVGVLAKMGPEAEEAIPWLIEAALDKDLRFGDGRPSPAAYRGTVLYSLSKMTWAKDRVIPVLQRIAQDGEEDPDVRASAIWALTNVPKEAMPILAKLTEAEDRRIRDSARSAIAQVMDKEGQVTKSDYYTQLIEKDPFDPSVPQYLWSTKGIINLGHPHPLTQKIKKLYRQRLSTEPDPELAWRLATIIQNGLRNTNLEWAAPAGGGTVRSPREDPAESYVTLAEVLELGFRHAQPNSQLWSKFSIALAKLRLLQGDWVRMNATLKNLGQEPIPAKSRPWLAAPPDDWQDDLHTKWQVADESMRSGDCSLEFKIEKDGKGLKGVHFLVKRAPEPTNVTYTGISTDTLFFAPYPLKDFGSFGYRAKDRPLTRYAISDKSGIVRFDRLPDIPVKVEVLVPTSNFPEAISNWDLWMEVEPGKFKIAKIYGGADAVGAGKPPAPEELRQGETVRYPRLVVRPTFRLNIKDWQRVDSDDLVLSWEGLDSLMVDKGLRYELIMSLSAPGDPHLSVEHAPVIKSAKLVTKQKQWPVGAKGVGGLRFEAGNIYMFEVRAIDESGTVVARWPRTRVWVPWGYRQSDPPFTYSYIGPDRPDRQDKPPIYERVWYRYPKEKTIRFIRDYPNAFEHEHARLGKAWLDWHEGDRDGARQQLQRLTEELPKGNVVRGTAIWLLQQMDENKRPLKRHRRLNFVPDED